MSTNLIASPCQPLPSVISNHPIVWDANSNEILQEAA